MAGSEQTTLYAEWAAYSADGEEWTEGQTHGGRRRTGDFPTKVCPLISPTCSHLGFLYTHKALILMNLLLFSSQLLVNVLKKGNICVLYTLNNAVLTL